jgi:NADH:ubiquinone oxidoreductase subunit C
MTDYIDIGPRELLAEAKAFRDDKARLVQIHCSYKKIFEIVYSFEGSYGLVHLRVLAPEPAVLESVSDFFPSAYLYENEISELFGIGFVGLSVDFKGRLYAPAKEAPFRVPVQAPIAPKGGEASRG